jgi:FkbM family methyltransferase
MRVQDVRTPQFEHLHAGKRTTARFLARLLAGTDLFVDLGAHEGFFSLLAARHNPALEIVATEPDAASCEILRKNVAMGRHDRIEVRQVALPSKVDAAKHGSAAQSRPYTPQIEQADLEAVSIEDLLRGRHARRMVVRIGAGQHLSAVLAELGDLLSRGLDLRLLVEIDRGRQPLNGIAPGTLLAEFDRLGFAVVLIDDEQDRFYRLRPDGERGAQVGRYGNLYCVPKDRVLSVVFFAHSEAAVGAERSLMELVDELVVDYGAICTVVVPSQAGPLVDSVTRSGAAVVVARLPWWGLGGLPHNERGRSMIRTGLVRGISDICRFLLPILEKVDPDVVFTQTLFIPWGAFAADVLEKPHAWNVCEFGELDHDIWFSDPFADIRAAIAAGSSFIFTNSDAVRTSLFSGFDPKRIRTIYRHIPIPESVKPADDAYLRANAVRLGLFASVQEGKGQHEAVQAVAELVRRGRDVELLLAGHCWASYSEYHARIDRLVDELALGDRVRMPGFLEDPYPAMAATNICLVCSRNEAFGRVAVEAMLLGRPVVYARSGGVAEYMEEGVTGLAYTPGDITELVERIEALIDNPARAAAIGTTAQRHAREKFTRNGYGGEVFRILQDLRGTTPEIDTPRRVVKAMAEAISADAAQLTEIRAALKEARQAQAARDHTLAEMQARLSALETSTLWRITHQLRIFLAPYPGLRRMIRGALKLVWWTATLQLAHQLRRRWGKDGERRVAQTLKRSLPSKVILLIQSRHRFNTIWRSYLIVILIKAFPHSAFRHPPGIGHLRGIDFYKGSKLISTVAILMESYRRFHGVYPNVLKPIGFSEKLFKSFFFTEMKVPESGNKLLTSSFIPADLKSSVTVPEIVWHSPMAKLPDNNEIKPGYYYLKASHGSAMFKRIRYPLGDDEFISLEKTCEKWLGNEYGLHSGEWWYNTFEKEILIEEQVGTSDESTSWYFYTFSGIIGLITAHKKSRLGSQFTWFDKNFEILPYQDPKFHRIENVILKENTRNELKHYACLIGRQFKFVRVDFLIDDNERIYLGEMTFSPAMALNSFPNELQAHLGNLWSQEL